MTVPHYAHIVPGGALPDVRSRAPFKAVIIVEADHSADWQKEVSDWLVASGCRYAMAWGPNCSSWDDSVDRADIEARGYEDDDSKFVMTTWHENESLEQVFWFSRNCALFSYDQVELANAVLVHISEHDRQTELLDLYDQSQTLAEREQND